MAEEQGRKARKVTTQSDEFLDGTFGRYDTKSSNRIYLNQNFLDNRDNSSLDWNSYNALNTVAHEGRHAYQDDCIKGIISLDDSRVSSIQLDAWKVNTQARMPNLKMIDSSI